MSTAPPQRKLTNLSLDRSLLPEARELKINLSRATEAGVRQKIARAKAELWKADNASANYRGFTRLFTPICPVFP